jgi:hypothetical protein
MAQQICKALLKGNTELLVDIYEKYQRPFMSLIRKRLYDLNTVEDVFGICQ